MVEFDAAPGRVLKMTDVSEVMSLYLLVDFSRDSDGNVDDNIHNRVINEIGSFTESKGKELESVTGGVMEAEGGKVFEEIEIILSTKEVDTEVAEDIMGKIKSMDKIETIHESILTCHLNETKERIQEKYGYVG